MVRWNFENASFYSYFEAVTLVALILPSALKPVILTLEPVILPSTVNGVIVASELVTFIALAVAMRPTA
jgi:hypothetical protein